jgi:membrane protein
MDDLQGMDASESLDDAAGDLRALWRAVVARMWAHDVPLVASGVAFFGTLSVFPALGAAIAAAALLLEPGFVQSELDNAANWTPQGGMSILRAQAEQVTGDTGAEPLLILILGLGGVGIAASRAMKMLMNGVNAAYGVTERRGFVARNLWALALTALAMAGGVCAFAVIVSAPPVIDAVGLSETGALMVNWLRWPALALITFVVLMLLYRGAGSRKGPRFRRLGPGAGVATLLWIAFSVAFSVYVGHVARFSAAYGVLGGVMILMLWMWVTSFLVLMCAELNAALDARGAGSGRRRSARLE